MNLSRARTIIDTSSRKMYKYYKEFAERLRPSSWCPATWCVVTIRTKRTFNSPTCAFRHERRVVVRHSFLREEKRFNRISPTQKTTATLTSRESFSPTHTHIRKYFFFLRLFLIIQKSVFRESDESESIARISLLWYC